MAAARSPVLLLPLVLAAAFLLSTKTAAASGLSGSSSTPSIIQCAQAAEQVGESNLLIRLASCSAGISESCCSSASGLLQAGGGGELAGCVCSPLFLQTTLSRVESNDLAKRFGVTRDTVLNILKGCKIKYSGGEGESSCDGEGGGGILGGGKLLSLKSKGKHHLGGGGGDGGSLGLNIGRRRRATLAV
jgi:hypothetical protein